MVAVALLLLLTLAINVAVVWRMFVLYPLEMRDAWRSIVRESVPTILRAVRRYRRRAG